MLNTVRKYIERKREEKEAIKIMKEDYLYYKSKIIMINDIVDDFRKHENENAYTAMRKITDIVKGW